MLATLKRHKPHRWNASPGLVAPQWRDFWRGLVFAPPFWEGSGRAIYDSVLRGSDGVFVNTPVWTAGQYGQQVSLWSGENDYIEFDHHASLVLTGDYTVASLFRTTDGGVLVAKFTAGGNYPGFILAVNRDAILDGRVSLWTGDTTANWLDAVTADADDGKWHLALGVLDGTTARVYVDGAQLASGTRSPNRGTSQPLDIGRRYDVADNFFGDIAGAWLWNRALSAAEVQRLASDPFGMFRPWYESFPAVLTPAAGNTIAVGLVTETDTALPLESAKAKAVGLASETDTAQPLESAKTRAAGLAQETDTALGVTGSAAHEVGLASELDTALALAAHKTQTVGLASESDSALALTGRKTLAAGLAAESDVALPLTAEKAITIGIAAELDVALPLALIAKTQLVGLAVETDTAFAVTVAGGAPAKFPGGGTFARAGPLGVFERSLIVGVFERSGMTGSFERDGNNP